MTNFTILMLLATGLAAFDMWLSRRRMHDYGVKVELNPIINWCARKFGIELGLLLGVFLPFGAITLLCQALGWEDAYAVYVGFRGFMFMIQVKSLKFERDLKVFKAQLERDLAACPSPPAQPSSSAAPNPPKEQ